MSVLIVKNTPSEGPGTIRDFLVERGMPHMVRDLSRGEGIPPLGDIEILVVMGGPMAVYEMDHYPYLKKEADLIRTAINKGKRVLGVCLGAQMIAHCLGARVYKGKVGQEVGWLDVALTPEGVRDPVMGSLAWDVRSPAVKVFHWHGDTFDLPGGATRLASSALYENQAFRYGADVYALQFHIEVNNTMVREWFAGEPGDHTALFEDTEKYSVGCSKRALDFYEKFFSDGINRTVDDKHS